MNNIIAIVATEAKHAAEGIDDFGERAKACMKASHNHWMATDKNEQFSGAVAALMMLSDEEEKERIEHTVSIMRAMNAGASGVPVDFSQLLTSNIKPFPLMDWWRETED